MGAAARAPGSFSRRHPSGEGRILDAAMGEGRGAQTPPRAVEVFLKEDIEGLSAPLTGAVDLVRVKTTEIIRRLHPPVAVLALGVLLLGSCRQNGNRAGTSPPGPPETAEVRPPKPSLPPAPSRNTGPPVVVYPPAADKTTVVCAAPRNSEPVPEGLFAGLESVGAGMKILGFSLMALVAVASVGILARFVRKP